MDTAGKKKRPHVVIAGAGIGGLAAALSLLQKGIDCDVYEQTPQVREIGAALWISPNGAKVLFELGLEDQLRRPNLAATEREIRLWSTGQAWTLYNQDTPTPWERTLFMMLRSEPQRMLAEAVLRIKSDAIHLNARAVGFKQDDQQVTVKFADGATVTCDALIGADGLHSKIRQAPFDRRRALLRGGGVAGTGAERKPSAVIPSAQVIDLDRAYCSRHALPCAARQWRAGQFFWPSR